MTQARSLNLNIGLDVGTASTKVVVQAIDERRRPPVVIRVGPAVAGYPAIGCPSCVAIEDDRIYFGSEALQRRNPSVVIQSFKMCVACKYGALACRGCQGRVQLGAETGCGDFRVLTSGGPLNFRGEHVAVMYVAWMRARIKDALREHFGTEGNITLLWNMSVPLAQADHDPLGKVFHQVLLAAGELEGRIEQGDLVQKCEEMVAEAWNRVSAQVGDVNIASQVVPETMAALLGFVRLKSTMGGLFGIVDVGAGTTDSSFFRYGGHGTPRLSFYATGADSVGGDEFDRAAAMALGVGDRATQERLASAVRLARGQADSVFVLDGKPYDLNVPEVHRKEASTGQLVWNSVHEVFGKAYRKEPRTQTWQVLPLLMVGGGTRLSAVRQALAAAFSPYVMEQPLRLIQADQTLQPGPGLSAADVQGNLDLLLVAHGLSYPLVEYETTRWPSEVAALPQPVALARFEADDLYGR